MDDEKPKFVTVQQIDGTTLKTPHARELETIATGALSFLPGLAAGRVRDIVESRMGGKIQDLGFGEDYSMSFEYFPDVSAHVVYHGPAGASDDEDDLDDLLDAEPTVKIIFSGERVTMVSSEDLASLVDLTMDFLRDLATNPGNGGKTSETGEKTAGKDVPSDLLSRSVAQRVPGFAFIEEGDLPALSAFIGGTAVSVPGGMFFSRKFFPGVEVALEYHFDGGRLDVAFKGADVDEINDYAKDQLAIFLMNHVLRFVAIEHPGEKLPAIVDKTFSFSYLKQKG